MTMIQLIACIGMIAGLFMVLHVSPRELSDSLFSRLTAAPGSIRADINETTRRKKAGFLRREITEAQAVLAASGRADRFPMVCFTSLLCFALGACIAIAAGNAFLVPVLAVGLMLTPFWYVKLTAGSFKKDVAAELETALSVITTAYLRTENFQQAVEENVRYLHPPVQEVFQRFLMRIKHIDPDMDAALVDLKAAIDNEVWREWCDAVMACQTDRSLTSILTPIVSKLSDMRVVNAELENLVFGPRKEFITMAILVLINIPLVRFINKDWYHTLVATIPGQMVIAVCLAAVFVSFAFVVKLTQAVAWAAENGIVNGVGNHKFEPDSNITREQMAAILFRYAAMSGFDTSARGNLDQYPDRGDVSGYAVEPLSWTVAEGLIKGTDNGNGILLDPQGNATRAQVATIIMRFIRTAAGK